jgi:hypothetical protein
MLDVRRAVQNALEAGREVLAAAEPYVVQYCEEMLVRYPAEFRPKVHLGKPNDVWSYVHFGSALHVSRRADGDVEDGVYLSRWVRGSTKSETRQGQRALRSVM